MKNYMRVLSHPIFVNLGFHMPMVVDLSHPLIMLQGENGSGKSTLLSSLYYALKGEEVEGFVYQAHFEEDKPSEVFLFDAEQHNPRLQLEFFDNQPKMKEMLQMASHGQVMLAMFRDSFPNLPDGTVLLLDEPEMALSPSNQRRVLKMLMELADQKNFRIVAATHSPIFIESKDTYVINLDKHVNKNVIRTDLGVEGGSTLH
jgi:predicted ATPase